MHHCSMLWEISLLYFFSWNLIWFLQKEPSTVQRTFDCSGKISPNLYFDRLLLLRVYKVSAKKVWRNYVSWYQRVLQNLKKNWLVVWQMTWGVWQILIRTLGSVKIGIFIGSFCPKYKMHELKIYRGVISNNTEEWWKIWLVISKST